jgi:hypothetical protein
MVVAVDLSLEWLLADQVKRQSDEVLSIAWSGYEHEISLSSSLACWSVCDVFRS